jgi:hypothetical protein
MIRIKITFAAGHTVEITVELTCPPSLVQG